MSNFKSGSGNLDFGSDDGDDETDGSTDEANETGDSEERDESSGSSSDESLSTASGTVPSQSAGSAERQRPDHESAETDADARSSSASPDYPYFVRRSNVGDERDTRLEIHVRDKVADREGAFRSELADRLGTNEVSKTDAREFALLAAFHHPDRVAELMREEGFGALD
jgi:hypothetical protein